MTLFDRLMRSTSLHAPPALISLSAVRARLAVCDDAEPAALSTAPYHVYDAPSYDAPGGPTHQPGVLPGHGYEALRTPFGATGIAGDGRARNVTDLDLAANRHPDGFAFAAENGRSTHHLPVMQRVVSAGTR